MDVRAEIDCINNRMKAAARLGLLPGQERHGDAKQTINYDDLDFALNRVAGNLLPQTLALERCVESVPETFKDSEDRIDIKGGNPVGETVAKSLIDSHDVKVKKDIGVDGDGLAWVLAAIFAFLSMLFFSLMCFGSRRFLRLAIRREGKPGGGTMMFLSRIFTNIRYRLRDRAVRLVSRMRYSKRSRYSRSDMRRYLNDYKFSYIPWVADDFMSSDDKKVVADQNAFVEAVKLVDEGDTDLVLDAVKRVKEIIQDYLSFTPDFLEIIEMKAAFVVSRKVSIINVPEERDILNLQDKAFDPISCGMPDVQQCSMEEVIKFDLQEVNCGATDDQTSLKSYVDLLRGLQYMFSLVGTVKFIAVYMAYSGKQYKCVAEAYASDLEMRKSSVDSATNVTVEKEKSSYVDEICLALAILFAMPAFISLIKSGGVVYRYFTHGGGPAARRRLRESLNELDNLEFQNRLNRLREGAEDLGERSESSSTIEAFERRLEMLREGDDTGNEGNVAVDEIRSDTAPGTNTLPNASFNVGSAPIGGLAVIPCIGFPDSASEQRFARTQGKLLRSVRNDNDFKSRSIPEQQIETVFRRDAADTLSNGSSFSSVVLDSDETFSMEKLEVLNKNSYSEVPGEMFTIMKGENVSHATVKLGNEDVVVVNADTDSPTVIAANSLSKLHKDKGIEFGTFNKEKILQLSSANIESSDKTVSSSKTNNTVRDFTKVLKVIGMAGGRKSSKTGAAKAASSSSSVEVATSTEAMKTPMRQLI